MGGARRAGTALRDRALRALRAAASPADAASARRFFREEVAFLGVPAPALRRVARELGRAFPRAEPVARRLAACAPLLADARHEPRALALLLCERWAPRLDASFVATARRWLEGGVCDNWALVDGLCLGSLGPLLARRPDLAPRLARWPASRSRWTRRASAAALIPAVRRGLLLPLAYATADRLLADRDDLVRKATGWLLREASRKDMRGLQAYLLARGPRVPRVALRAAVERFPPARRRRLLHATRAGA